jgi:hypothetical protein
MFDNYIFTEGSCRNFAEGGKTGYELSTLISYYRGIPFSMIHDVRVEADGVAEPREALSFSVDRERWYSLAELETMVNDKWEYGTQGWIRVERAGGLAAGEHEVKLTMTTRVAYIPVPFSGSRTRRVKIAR